MDKGTLAKFVADESGATAIEYGLIGSIVSICIVLALTHVSGSMQGMFNSIATDLQPGSK